MNDKSKPYFKLLEDVGILHYTPQSLNKKLTNIYQDPMKWWQQDKIQEVKNIFCNIFANRKNYFIDDYKMEINKLLNEGR